MQAEGLAVVQCDPRILLTFTEHSTVEWGTITCAGVQIYRPVIHAEDGKAAV